MNKFAKISILAGIAAALAVTTSAQASELDDPSVQKTLRAMANADTDWHPDLAGEFNGMRYYAKGKFKSAMEHFLSGAYYADKLSQLSIGLMYANGEGVEKDPVTAYAWVDLATERNYPDFVLTRDSLKEKLTPDQLYQAQAKRAELAKTYADGVAKPRLAVQLRFGQTQLTGSRLGYNSGVMSALSVPGVGDEADAMVKMGRCAGPAIFLGKQEAPITGCGGDALFTKTFWQPDQYFAQRDRSWNGVVTVGPINEDKSSSRPASSQPL